MPSWRRSRSRRSRRDTSKPGTPAAAVRHLQRVLGGQRTVRLPRGLGNSAPSNDTNQPRPRPRILMRRCGPGFAPVPRIIRGGGFDPPITTPAPKAGQSIRRRFNALARRRAASAAASAPKTPRHLDRATDGDRGCAQPGVGGGFPIRFHHRRAAGQDRLDHDEHTRECLGGMVERSITGEHLMAELNRLAAQRGTYLAVLRCDNGPELACSAVVDRADSQVGVVLDPRPASRGETATSNRSTPASVTTTVVLLHKRQPCAGRKRRMVRERAGRRRSWMVQQPESRRRRRRELGRG